MNYPLEALLSLRHFRENAAKAEVKTQEHKLNELKLLVEKAKEEYENYKTRIPELIEKEYSVIIGKECFLKDIEAVKEKVALINQGLVDREMRVFEAEKKVEEQKINVQKAKEAVSFARKEAAKIEMHKDIWAEEQKKEAERAEDLELEEFTGVKDMF